MWIWFAGGFSLLLIIVLIVVAVVRNNAPEAEPVATPSAAPTATATAEPEASTAPTATPLPTSTPSEAGTIGDENGYIALDTFADFETGSPALWASPTPSGWEVTVVDQDGLNQISNTALSCMYTTSQSYQDPIDASATSDQSDTAAMLVTIEEAFASQTMESTTTPLDNVDIAWGLPGAASKMEFVSSRVDYTRADTGEAYSTVFVVRATPQIGGLLYASVNCPSATFGSATDPTQALLDGSSIIPSF